MLVSERRFWQGINSGSIRMPGKSPRHCCFWNPIPDWNCRSVWQAHFFHRYYHWYPEAGQRIHRILVPAPHLGFPVQAFPREGRRPHMGRHYRGYGCLSDDDHTVLCQYQKQDLHSFQEPGFQTLLCVYSALQYTTEMKNKQSFLQLKRNPSWRQIPLKIYVLLCFMYKIGRSYSILL